MCGWVQHAAHKLGVSTLCFDVGQVGDWLLLIWMAVSRRSCWEGQHCSLCILLGQSRLRAHENGDVTRSDNICCEEHRMPA